MILKGTIYITYDINLCLANLNQCRTIIIADEPDQYKIPGSVGGSLLLPPYEAMTAMIDGDDQKFRYTYLDYLKMNYSVDKFISIILQALIAGTNIIFLLDPEAPKFELILKEFFMMQYGILLGDSRNPFRFDISYTSFILNKLYAEDDISKEAYLRMFPQEMPFDQFTIQKLLYEHGLNLGFNDAMTYFKKQSLILKNGGIIQGIVKRPE